MVSDTTRLPISLTTDGRAIRFNPAILSLVSFVAFLVPPRYAVGPAGLGFNLITFLGICALFGWAFTLILPARAGAVRWNPVRIAILTVLLGDVFSYGVAFSRPIDGDSSNGAIRSLIIALSLLGLALAVCDGIKSEWEIHRLFHWVLLGSYVSALVGVGQKLFSFDYVNYWADLPFLHASSRYGQLSTLLSGRAIGTANHPIELSVVSAVLVGIAVVQSRWAPTPTQRGCHRLGALLLVSASLLAVSRSGFFDLVIVGLGIISSLPWRSRLNALVLLIIAGGCLQVVASGTLSTLRYQLQHIGSDNSSRGRLDDYGQVLNLFQAHPWIGIGPVYSPSVYGYLDNGWLGLAITQGVVGVLLFVGILVAALFAVGTVRRSVNTKSFSSELARAIAFALVALAVSNFFFDQFSFPQVSLVFYLMVGTVGALYTIRGHSESAGTPKLIERPA